MSKKEKFRSYQTDYLNVKQAVSKYVHYWYIFLISLIACLILAFLYLYWAVPQYRVLSTLLLKTEDADATTAGKSDLSEVNVFSSTQQIDNEIEVLKSNSLMQRVFSELSLNPTFHVKEQFKTKEIYGSEVPIRLSITKLHPTAYTKQVIIRRKTSTTFELKEDNGELSTHKYGEEISKPYGIFTVIAAQDNRTHEPIIIKFHDSHKMANNYNEMLKVEAVNDRASVIRISLVESVPQRGKDIMNKLLEIYSKEALDDRNLIANTTIQFIDDRLKLLTSELSGGSVVQNGRTNDLTDATSNADQSLALAGDNATQLEELRVQIEVLESIETYINKQPGKFELVPSTLTVQDPALVQLITRFNELQLERERMLRTTLPNNPLVQDINEQLSSLQLNILENLHNIKNRLTIRQKSLQTTSGRFRAQRQKVPSIERDLLSQQGTKANLYLYLLQKREESALALETTVSKTRMLDTALVEDEAVSPKRSLIYLLALLVGFGIPFSGIYIRDLLNDKVQSKRDVHRGTDTPILGEISHNNSKKSLIVVEDAGTSIAELFRLIRSNLHFAAAGKENKVVLITSSTSGEGKTFFCINLAASLTLIGKKVVLLELDLRMPSLSKQLDVVPGLGISDYLVASDKVQIEDILRPFNPVPGLFYASSGSLPPNPAELMMSHNLAHFVNELKASFDYIIIDTPPVGKVSDAFSLSSLIDSTIYMVRYNYTQKNHLDLIEDIYSNKKLAHPMIVLNDVKEESSRAYGYGYSYGYKKSEKQEVSIS
jgi:capsular exopolysaccharide synthesis family protein